MLGSHVSLEFFAACKNGVIRLEGRMHRANTVRQGILFASLLSIVAPISLLHSQLRAPDLILSNGKIITVDERFTIPQAVAKKCDRIISVGPKDDISRLSRPNAKKTDMNARSVSHRRIDIHTQH